jgi:hypothetical protein
MIADAVIRGVYKTAFAIEVDVSLKADGTESHLSGFPKTVIQQGFPEPLALEVRMDTDWAHGKDGNNLPAVCMDVSMHVDTLADKLSFRFHHKVQLRNEGRIRPQAVKDIMLQAAWTIYVPEGFTDEVLYLIVF